MTMTAECEAMLADDKEEPELAGGGPSGGTSGGPSSNTRAFELQAVHRRARLEGLRRAIANGTYRVSAEELAEAMLAKAEERNFDRPK